MVDLSKITGTSDTMFKAIMYTHKDILKAIINLCTNKNNLGFNYGGDFMVFNCVKRRPREPIDV